MSVWGIITTVLGIAGGLVVLITFAASLWTARGSNQRQLRQRLRDQLRDMKSACDCYFQRGGWEEVGRMPQFSIRALSDIRDDGLISPNRAHIAGLKAVLHEIRGRSDFSIPLEAVGREEHDRLKETNNRRLRIAFETLDNATSQYQRALGKMDNAGLGGYWTYTVYRFVPPHRGMLARLLRA
ncbi:hypothetical protein [Mycobacterium sp. 236(2023)]|uniref:hypothetical protein n=1 Tax=Mycobacterium sp. 236(2023) TaxID=3038163 RepID=UPI0024151251|nr:hypothetical protein [Mycobacterium sp. 236(2023)]MDG4669471.1 hypothetical protein [Mycobacterium sp. 236(2023)]